MVSNRKVWETYKAINNLIPRLVAPFHSGYFKPPHEASFTNKLIDYLTFIVFFILFARKIGIRSSSIKSVYVCAEIIIAPLKVSHKK